ncbi:MAG: hypothetical protein EBR01_09860 [Proteobacteria bacterium]|nr:hypothetical protein [Pseudomonadota bacterium]
MCSKEVIPLQFIEQALTYFRSEVLVQLLKLRIKFAGLKTPLEATVTACPATTNFPVEESISPSRYRTSESSSL